MPFTTFAWGQDLDIGGTTQGLTAMQGETGLFYSGDNVRVPTYNQLTYAWAGLASGGDSTIALSSPSMRDEGQLYINPINHLADSDAETSDPIAVYDIRSNPRALVVDENATVNANSNSSAACFQWLFVSMSDGVLTPVTGNIQSQRAVSSTSVTAQTWSDCTLSFTNNLQFGTYQIVGLRGIGATMVGARINFKGSSGIGADQWFRPGVPCSDSATTADAPGTRFGQSGVFGVFQSTTPPSIEVVCTAGDSSQEFILDLIQVS